MSKLFPASTSSSAPLRDSRDAFRGWYLKEIILHVPAGHEAKVPVWFEFQGVRIVPTDGNELRFDDISDLPLPVGVVLDRDGAFDLVGYNEDTIDAHTTRAVAIFLLEGEDGYPTELAKKAGAV